MSISLYNLWPLSWSALALTYFCMERGSIEFHDAELLQEKKFICDVFPPPQLMPFPWFPLCPTLGYTTGHGDTPKYINSLTHSKTH